MRPHFDAFDVLWLQYVGGGGLSLMKHDRRLVDLRLWRGVEHSDIERYGQTTGNHQLTMNRHLQKFYNKKLDWIGLISRYWIFTGYWKEREFQWPLMSPSWTGFWCWQIILFKTSAIMHFLHIWLLSHLFLNIGYLFDGDDYRLLLVKRLHDPDYTAHGVDVERFRPLPNLPIHTQMKLLQNNRR